MEKGTDGGVAIFFGLHHVRVGSLEEATTARRTHLRLFLRGVFLKNTSTS